MGHNCSPPCDITVQISVLPDFFAKRKSDFSVQYMALTWSFTVGISCCLFIILQSCKFRESTSSCRSEIFFVIILAFSSKVEIRFFVSIRFSKFATSFSCNDSCLLSKSSLCWSSDASAFNLDSCSSFCRVEA